MRLGEICDLRWGAVDFESEFITIRETENFRPRNGHEDRIPIIAQAEKILRKWEKKRTGTDGDEHVFKGVRGESLYPNYVSTRFRHYRKKAGLPDSISFHSLQHTCASWLIMEGVPLQVVQAMLRHSTSDITERYAHLAPDAYKNQICNGFAGL